MRESEEWSGDKTPTTDVCADYLGGLVDEEPRKAGQLPVSLTFQLRTKMLVSALFPL
jgi:hypothetical protein